MSRRVRVPRCRRPDDDSGMAMLLVIGTAVVLMILSVTMVSVTQASLRSSAQHNNFEASLGVAETGIDRTLARVQSSINSATVYAFGPTAPTFVTAVDPEAEERKWARKSILDLAVSAANLSKTGEGEYIAIRPTNRQTIYSMSWVPNYAAWAAKSSRAKSRLIKAEYIFSPYAPDKAILTQGPLEISGSVAIDASNPSLAAGVHTNSDINSNSASLTVTGSLTSSGSYNVNSGAALGAGSGGSAAQVTVPAPDPRVLYVAYKDTFAGVFDASLGYTGSWYDLCPDGFARMRGANQEVPCTGARKLNPVDGATPTYPYRGWTYASVGGVPTWSMSEKSSPFDGVFYVHQGNAVIDGKSFKDGPPWHASVIAEAGGSGCARIGGNIEWKLQDTQNFLDGVVFAAGADLSGSANNEAYSGMFSAADQIYLSSSSQTITGWIIAGDACPDTAKPSKVQGVTIHFDKTAEAPILSAVRTTLWLEYVGS